MPEIAPARLAAYSALHAVNTRAADLPAALAHARTRLRDERDRALAGEITVGTLRWQGAFDHLIASYARRPLDRLDGEIVDVLRLTIYQLLHLERIPASAAVNDAVNLARTSGKRSAAPLVNAVLRRISRERARLPLPPRVEGDGEAELDYLSITLSHPRWLARRWRERHGFAAAEAWCRFNNGPAPLTLRANRLRHAREAVAGILSAAGVETRAARVAPDALVVQSGNPLLIPGAGASLFTVQDETSQLVGAAMNASPGERLLDACAAPGGKTTGMAAAMGDHGLIVAMDVRPNRVKLLAETVRASGAASIRIVRADAARALPVADGTFDGVLVDAPCSGLGTVRRDPDIKWRRSEAELPGLAAVQVRILQEAARTVRPGGRILYATCSSEPEENEEVATRFVREVPGFTAGPVRLPTAPQLVDERGHLRTLPFRDGMEAFFAALLVKGAGLR